MEKLGEARKQLVSLAAELAKCPDLPCFEDFMGDLPITTPKKTHNAIYDLIQTIENRFKKCAIDARKIADLLTIDN